MNEFWRAISSDEAKPVIWIDITDIPLADRNQSKIDFIATLDNSYKVYYHICDHLDHGRTGCMEDAGEQVS
jgi:gentisate 1,2-dioxygenase